MGCWNETCVLTRTPIAAGMPVVVLTEVVGMQFKGNEAIKALLIGMPLVGQYDDYGGVEALTHPEQFVLQQKALLNSGFYREIQDKEGNAVKVAAGADTLWALTHSMQHFFHAENGITPSMLSGHTSEYYEKRDVAYKAIDQALKDLGDKLAALPDAIPEGSVQDAVFKAVVEVFGPDKAWMAYNYMAENGLYAYTSQIFMHKAAYDALVEEFGARTLHYYEETKYFTVREHVKSLLEECIHEYKTKYDTWHDLLKDHYTEPNLLNKRIQDYINVPKARVISPTTRPWTATEFPVIGNYWGGATFEEIFNVVPYEQIIDYLVFQWAINYTRVELTKPSIGSQCREVALHQYVFDKLKPVLEEHGLTGTDYMGTVFRNF